MNTVSTISKTSQVFESPLVPTGIASTSKRKSDMVYLTHAKKKKLNEDISPTVSKSLDHVPEKLLNEQAGIVRADSKPNSIVEQYTVNEVVWAKIKGSIPWPAKITSIATTGLKRYEVVWFNDYRKSKLYRSQISKFHTHFIEFSVHFPKSIKVETAAKEALLYLSQNS